jgi:hypothetical protein
LRHPEFAGDGIGTSLGIDWALVSMQVTLAAVQNIAAIAVSVHRYRATAPAGFAAAFFSHP